MSLSAKLKGDALPLTGSNTQEKKGLNTFFGVYIPSILSIFGVIMYLRLSWILGNVGIVSMVSIILISSLITFITGLSISAIATNMHIKGGGAYYMLSRSFGIEIGAAIGIPLYFAQVIGIAFYIEGFSESFCSIFPILPPALLEITLLGGLTLLAFWSADFAIKGQTIIFAMIGASLLSIFFGNETHDTATLLSSSGAKSTSLSFWAAFAIFFPAVTGIEAGFAMSGDLKNPRKALPLGTLAAVLTGVIVYLILTFFLYYKAPEDALIHDPFILQHLSRFQSLVLLGIWGATLSSALGGILGAPRTMQALSKDGLLPKMFGKGFGPMEEPRVATAVSFLLVSVILYFGNINFIAPVLTMFFLISYGMLNFATGLETLLGNPSWRPTFFTSSILSIIGGSLCIIAMFMIDPGATFIATLFILFCYLIVRKFNHNKKWDDIREGILLYLIRTMIYSLSGSKLSARSWRPNFLVFSGSPQHRTHLINFASSITLNKGFLTTVMLIPEKKATHEKGISLEETVKDYYRKKKIKSLVEVVLSENIYEGMKAVIANYGLGRIIPNTVVIGDSLKDDQYAHFAEVIQLTNALHKNLVIIKGDNEETNKPEIGSKTIDLWWDDKHIKNSHLMVVLAYMLQSSENWKDHKIVVKCCVPNESAREMRIEHFKDFFEKSRLNLEIKVLVVNEEKENFHKTVSKFSDKASLVFLGLAPPEPTQEMEQYISYYTELMNQNKQIPYIAYVMSSEHVDLKQIFH